MNATAKIPATIITGFLGAGKTTVVRHVLNQAQGRRIAIIVNEFGSLGIDGDLLRHCGIEGCEDDNIVELSNGCLCCTVADDFIPTMQALLDRPQPPEHILIETSGLALPKPLLKAFNWPAIRSRVTVDGVIAVIDAPAAFDGRFADDPAAVAAQRAADPQLDHDNPLAEVFEDQLHCADLILLNKCDQLDDGAIEELRQRIAGSLERGVKLLPTREGRVDLAILGLSSAAEDDLAARKSHHDAMDGEHEHDDFESFVIEQPEIDDLDALLHRVRDATAAHDILRIKGFLPLRGKPMRLVLQGVGQRLRHNFDRPWRPGETRAGGLVVIGRAGLDQTAIRAMISG